MNKTKNKFGLTVKCVLVYEVNITKTTLKNKLKINKKIHTKREKNIKYLHVHECIHFKFMYSLRV